MIAADRLPTDVGDLLADWSPVFAATAGILIILVGAAVVKGPDVAYWWRHRQTPRQTAKRPTISAALGYPEPDYSPRHLDPSDSEESTTTIRAELPPPQSGRRVSGSAPVGDPLESPTARLVPAFLPVAATRALRPRLPDWPPGEVCPRCKQLLPSSLSACSTPACLTADLDEQRRYERAMEWDR